MITPPSFGNGSKSFLIIIHKKTRISLALWGKFSTGSGSSTP
jgi:hypothetical protein